MNNNKNKAVKDIHNLTKLWITRGGAYENTDQLEIEFYFHSLPLRRISLWKSLHIFDGESIANDKWSQKLQKDKKLIF